MISPRLANWALFLAPLISLAITLWLIETGWPPERAMALGITLLTASWWIFEPIPIPVTSFIPIASFPLLGILTANEVGQSYGSPLILLLLGGFILFAAFKPDYQWAAMIMAGVSMVGFALLVVTTGGYNAAIGKVLTVDIVGIVFLAIATVLKYFGNSA